MPVSKTVDGGSNPSRGAKEFCGYNSMVEYLAFNQEVGGFESPCPYQYKNTLPNRQMVSKPMSNVFLYWLVSIVWPIAPPCHGGGHRFESGTGRQVCRGVWKWSSAWSHKPRIVGSNPTTATSFRILSAIKKTLLEIKQKAYPVEQFRCSTAVVQVTVNHLVVGSIPATGAIFESPKARRHRLAYLTAEGVPLSIAIDLGISHPQMVSDSRYCYLSIKRIWQYFQKW
jgi:hypothetical protein